MRNNDRLAALGTLTLLVLVFVLIFQRPSGVNAQIQIQTSVPCYVANGTGSTGAVVTASCRNAPVTLRGISFVNISGTLAFLRLYNTRNAPVCTSNQGFVESIPIPTATTGSGIVDLVRNFQYSQGLGFCLTGGPANNNNAPPPAGVFGVIALSN